MAFTEEFEHKIEIIPPYSIIQDREATIVKKDGVEIGRSYHRISDVPGDDVSKACDEVKKVANALWTSALIAEYQAANVTPTVD
jgi:hypothetical protein